MPEGPIQTVHTRKEDLSEYLKRYKFQPDLTAYLDTLPDQPFSQETVNEIVLWKVNRYVRIPNALRESLYALRTLGPNEHRESEPVLLNLLDCKGVDLPMASTFLRFQNANVFQIVDRHAYRAVFGKRYPVHSAMRPNAKLSIYFEYLDALHSLTLSSGTSFRDLDRMLYVFDKDHNGTLSNPKEKT